MKKINNNKYEKLAKEIYSEYSKMCGNNCCGECKYAFLKNCAILFTLDYLERIKEEEGLNAK